MRLTRCTCDHPPDAHGEGCCWVSGCDCRGRLVDDTLRELIDKVDHAPPELFDGVPAETAELFTTIWGAGYLAGLLAAMEMITADR